MRNVIVSAALLLLVALPGRLPAQEGQEESSEEACRSQLQASSEASLAQKFISQAQQDTTASEEQQRTWYRQAWEAVQGSIDEGSEDPTLYLLGAQAKIGLADYERAGDLTDRFLELAPECSKFARQVRYAAWARLYNTAINHYQGGSQDSALAYFEKASTLYPDARSLVNAAALRRQRGERDSAAALYRKAIESGGEGEEARQQLQQAVSSLASMEMQAGDTEAAMQIYRDYLADHPEDPLVQLNYAQALADQGQSDSAQVIFTQVLNRGDLSFQEWTQLGIGLFRSEAFEDAVTAFQRARRQNPLNKETMENLASAMVQAGQHEAAAALGDTLASWYPYDAQNLSVVLRAYGQTGQRPKAQELADRLQNSPFMLHQLGMMETSTGHYDIEGSVENANGEQGDSFTLVFELVNDRRQVVKSKEVSIELPPQGERKRFQVSFTSGAPATSFRYHLKESSD